MKKEYDLALPVTGKTGRLVPLKLLSAEKLLRLNPHWIIKSVAGDNGGFTASVVDHETERSFELEGSLDADNSLLHLSFSGVEFKDIKFLDKDQQVWVEVDYLANDKNDENNEPEENTERHVVMWLRSIKEYFRLYQTNSVNTLFFRFLMNKVILPMTPSQRKISLMLVRITAVELAVILLIVAAYVTLN